MPNSILGPAVYMATGKLIGSLPISRTAQIARQVAAEGMVLLKNDGTLPLKTKKVALFGAGAEDTAVCGTGSGFAFSPYIVNVRQGLENAGLEITSSQWLKNYQAIKKQGEKKNKISLMDKRFSGIRCLAEEQAITPNDLEQSKAADTAIYVIRRNTGENFDRKPEKGDYYLSDMEEKNLRLLADYFAHTVVVLNTCVIDAALIESIPGVSAILLMGQAGMEAGNALADLLTGRVTPSGKLTDTWAKRYEDYPASATFSANDGNTQQEDYNEDIFVGYRYFDTFGLEVVYPFGYGLSYTGFAYHNIHAKVDWEHITITVTVQNTGSYSGREVIQVYASAPSGRLPQPYQELKGYAKTALLAPGTRETVTITFATEALSSYDESKAAWVMEPGDYLLRVGTDSRHTSVGAVLRLDTEAITRQLSNKLRPDHELKPITPPARELEAVDAPVIELHAADCVTVDNASKIKREVVTYRTAAGSRTLPLRKFQHPVDCEERVELAKDCPHSTLYDVVAGTVSMEEFVASLDTETLLRIVTGTGSETKHPVSARLPKGTGKARAAMAASGKTTAQYVQSLGIPTAGLSDGPAGLHLMGTPSTAYPVGMVVAQCWDTDAANQIGDCFGMEMEHYDVFVILGPSMNIHRDPLCGRNFEYYSEDPLLTGSTAAAFTKGLQTNHPGYGVPLKHFAANNRELDRMTSNSTISERALREIYLKGFEICVREAKPLTVMSSYNCLNGLHTSSQYELLTDILRGEWGFDGFVMTDWDSQSEKPFDLHAGNDIIMGGYPTDVIAAAIDERKPQFDLDGAIHQNKIAMYGGVFHKKVDAWNSFSPEKGGKDTVTVQVASNKKLSPRVTDAVAQGWADIRNNADGSKTVTYYGTNRGAWLPLGDIQRCAANVLRVLMNNAPMRLLREK